MKVIKDIYLKNLDKKILISNSKFRIINNEINIINNTNEKILQKCKKNKIKEAVFFYHKYDYNWRHFICQLFYLLNYLFISKESKIIIPKDDVSNIKKKHKMEIIKILNLQNRLVILDNSIFVEKLIICNNKINKVNGKILNLLIEKCNKLSKINTVNNLYLCRLNSNNKNPSKRPIKYHEDFVEKYINQNSKVFRVTPEKFNLIDQIKLISNAKNIYSLIGAGCDNVIFKKNNCKFHILTPNVDTLLQWSRWYVNNYKNYYIFTYIVGEKDNDCKQLSNDKFNVPWVIDLDSKCLKNLFKM